MTEKTPSLIQSLTPIIVLVVLIFLNVVIIGNDTLSGANQLSLLAAAAVAVVIAVKNGVKATSIIQGITHTVSSALPAVMILFVIGMLSAAWMVSGIVPSMIYYGLNILRPDYFLPATMIIASIISIAVGSSWSTVATIGVALLGIGRALGFNDGIIAGAIISGAYFGDKISPLSDTTNLAAAVTGTPLFTHIRYMMQTTVPSFVLALVIFTVISLTNIMPDEVDMSNQIQQTLAGTYHISGWLFIVPVLTIVMIVKKFHAIPVLFIGSIMGVICALLFQGDVLRSLSVDGEYNAASMYKVISQCLYGPTQMNTGVEQVDSLLSTGGMRGMLNTVWMIIMAMIFGGVLEAGHFLEKIMVTITKRVKSTGGIVTSTVGTAVLFNLTAGDQYMSIVVPGKMYSELYRKHGLKSELLSRSLEDSATVTSVLIPWNTCGATQASVLGVSTMLYAPFAFFCYFSPVITMIYAWFNIKIKKSIQNKSDEQ